MRTYKTEGIILKRTNVGEADRIITLYSKHFGKIRVLAKGIRKPTSKKSPSLELFNWVKVLIAPGRNLDLVTEATSVRVFKNLKKDLKKVSLAYHFCELTERLTAENVKNRKIFNLLAGGLLGLEKASSTTFKQAISNFEQKLLEETGFWPKDKSPKNIDLEAYIERIIERKIASRRVFKDLI